MKDKKANSCFAALWPAWVHIEAWPQFAIPLNVGGGRRYLGNNSTAQSAGQFFLHLSKVSYVKVCTVAFYQNESCLSCLHPPSSYGGRREQGRQLSIWWKTLILILGSYGILQSKKIAGPVRLHSPLHGSRFSSVGQQADTTILPKEETAQLIQGKVTVEICIWKPFR